MAATGSALSIVGLHKLEPTPELVEQALRVNHDPEELHWAELRRARHAVQAELATVFLLEVVIRSPGAPFDMFAFRQTRPELLSSSQQVPYLDRLLTPDGTKTVTDVPSAFDIVPELLQGDFRIAFFLHFLDPDKPLATPFGLVTLPPVTSLPARLTCMRYEPVD